MLGEKRRIYSDAVVIWEAEIFSNISLNYAGSNENFSSPNLKLILSSLDKWNFLKNIRCFHIGLAFRPV